MKNNNENSSLKKITFIDRIRNKIRGLLGYKEGEQFVYNVKPLIKTYSEIENGVIANIEDKLRRILALNESSGKLVDGLEENEAKKLIEWVVQRDRLVFKETEHTDLENDSMAGGCGFSQEIVTVLLDNMGLKSRILNVSTVTDMKYLASHAFTTLEIPIKDSKGDVKNENYLIDATYRQMFLRDKISVSNRFVKDKRFGNKASPIAGYWCINMPGGKEFANTLLRDGFIQLNPQTAKIYGDSFILERLKDDEYKKIYDEGVTIPVSTIKDLSTGISGEQYMQWLTDYSRKDFRANYFNQEEMMEKFGDLLKTPLMKKTEITQNQANPIQKQGRQIDIHDIEKE